MSGRKRERRNKNAENGIMEIPGFYYDASKNKYFKISKDFPAPKTPPVHCTNVKRNARKDTFLDTVMKRSSNASHPALIFRRTQDILIEKIAINKCCVTGVELADFSPSSLECMKVSRDGRLFASVRRTRDGMNSMIRIDGIINNGGRVEEQAAHSVNNGGRVEEQAAHSINNGGHLEERAAHSYWNETVKTIEWSAHDEPWLMAHSVQIKPIIARHASTILLCRIDSTTSAIQMQRLFVHRNVSCMRWSATDPNLLALGLDDGLFIGDMSRPGREFTNPEPSYHGFVPEDIAFSKSGSFIIVGCKSGDLKLLSRNSPRITKIVAKKKYRSCIDCVRLLRDENYVIASNWQGDMCLYDLRTRGIVHNYLGHRNNYRKIEFALDSANENLFAVGSDEILRCWQISTGKLLHSLPRASMCPTTCDSSEVYPVIEYTNNWSGYDSMTGLLYGYENSLTFSPLACGR